MRSVVSGGLQRLSAATRPARVRSSVTIMLLGNASLWDRAISRTYFELAAVSWRRFGDNPEHVAPYVAALSACREPQRVLDIGTGAGGSARAAARHWPHADIVAIDSSRLMLTHARRGDNPSNVTFRRASVLRLPFADGEFDLVTGLNAPLAFREVSRVLRPDGQILMSYTFAGSGNSSLTDGVVSSHGWRRVAHGEAGASGNWALLERERSDATERAAG